MAATHGRKHGLSAALSFSLGLVAAAGAAPVGAAAPPAYRLAPAYPHLTFTQPTDLQRAPGVPDRLFVVEQAGRIRSFSTRGEPTAAPVCLDLTDRVAAGGEMGLLGLAFHPRFATRRTLYLNYTADAPRRTRISRFRAANGPGTAIEPASEQVLLSIPQPYANHNGGQLAFGPDGKLYIATGDGGSRDDPHGHGQRLDTLLGKVLRLDVDRPGAGAAYGVPPDNPFVGRPGARPEIWAYGLRNPWRMAFDPATGALWAGDVGQDRWEEVDHVVRGGNHGWNVMEGDRCREGTGCDPSRYVAPVATYGHDQGQSVTGGLVYRGRALPGLWGHYLYADFASGRLWALDPVGAHPEPRRLLDTGLMPSTFGLDADGEVLLADYGSGRLFRLVGR
ncbi:MAG: PQQ-dependent sugar dehydrogenase [Candidatus Sericytochromatia bacterium]|nr:PQQ-dependent sugar dehydrogenase [Candidatus Sericytochromatia bacterium]